MNRCSELQDSSPRPVLSGSNQILHGIASPFFYVSQPTAFSLSASASTTLQETLLNKHCVVQDDIAGGPACTASPLPVLESQWF